MKIKMKTLAAGPDGVKQPGQVYDVGDVEANGLVAGNYAEFVEASKADTAGPVDNSFNAETGELIGYCSIVPAKVGEEHIFGDALHVFVREDDGKLYFSKPQPKPISLEEFTALKADEQKALLKELSVEGDDGNEEKRVSLYDTYLQKVGDTDGTQTGNPAGSGAGISTGN